MSDGAENRKFNRVLQAFFTAAKWYEENGKPRGAEVGNTINISEGGILMEVENAPPFLSTISLSLGFDEDIIKIEGQVTRVQKRDDGKIEIGIKFINLNDKDREFIQKSILETN